MKFLLDYKEGGKLARIQTVVSRTVMGWAGGGQNYPNFCLGRLHTALNVSLQFNKTGYFHNVKEDFPRVPFSTIALEKVSICFRNIKKILNNVVFVVYNLNHL